VSSSSSRCRVSSIPGRLCGSHRVQSQTQQLATQEAATVTQRLTASSSSSSSS
jgi:hypothetical protein